MSDTEGLTPAEAQELFGAPVEAVVPDPQELEVALVLRTIRSLLAETAEADGVGVNELARRLDVAPSAVSRMLRSEGDMRVSTAVLCALALDRTWEFRLRDNRPAISENQREVGLNIVDPGDSSTASVAVSGTIAPSYNLGCNIGSLFRVPMAA